MPVRPINSLSFGALFCLTLLLVGCAAQPTIVVDSRTDRTPNTMGLDSRDFDSAAGDIIRDIIASGRLNKPDGGRYVIVISRVINDTMQLIDTDQLIKKIRIELNNSGKAIVTTAVGLVGPEDPMLLQTPQLRASAEFKQTTVAGQGQRVAPDLSLSGKLIQKNNRVGSSSQQRADYSFQLTITDIRTGLAFWEGEARISKVGTNQTVTW